MAPAGWEGSPGRLAFFADGFEGTRMGDGGDGDEKKVGECLVVWGFIRIFAAPFAAKNGCNGNKRGGHRWVLTETKGAAKDGR